MESMLEAFPQLIVQMYFFLQTSDGLGGSNQTFVLFSIFFSMVSMTNKAVSEDKVVFYKDDDWNWQDAKWSLKCKNGSLVSLRYLFRLFFRICDISGRITVIVVIWFKFGGLIVFGLGFMEFIFLMVIAWKSKELRPVCNMIFLFGCKMVCLVCSVCLFYISVRHH